MPTLTAMVDLDTEGMRLDAFLANMPGAPSRSACVRLIDQGAASINGTPATEKKERVYLGDCIELELDDAPAEDESPLEPRPDIPLDIRFEDEYLIVLAKQAGLVCHPSPGHVSDTLANALVAHCGYDNLGLLQGEDRPGIVHRLDMDTTGLMVCAKTTECQERLQDLIRLRALDRRYITLVHGNIAHDEGIITTGIARSRRDPMRMCVSDAFDAREAITEFKVLERFDAGARDDGYTLIECHLWTGRTHQIRLHMRHIGHPCVGDPLYGRGGKNESAANRGLTRQFLHSWRIAFEHPMTGEQIELTCALPADLIGVLCELEPLSLGLTEYGSAVVQASRIGVPRDANVCSN